MIVAVLYIVFKYIKNASNVILFYSCELQRKIRLFLYMYSQFLACMPSSLTLDRSSEVLLLQFLICVSVVSYVTFVLSLFMPHFSCLLEVLRYFHLYLINSLNIPSTSDYKHVLHIRSRVVVQNFKKMLAYVTFKFSSLV